MINKPFSVHLGCDLTLDLLQETHRDKNYDYVSIDDETVMEVHKEGYMKALNDIVERMEEDDNIICVVEALKNLYDFELQNEKNKYTEESNEQ